LESAQLIKGFATLFYRPTALPILETRVLIA